MPFAQQAAILLAALCCALPASAYQAQVKQANVQLRSAPDLRQSKEVQRLSPQKVQTLSCHYASDSSLWCQVRLTQGSHGWIQARFLDPVLKQNFPVQLADLPGLLLFEHAQQELVYSQNLNSPEFKNRLRSALLTMELSLIKQRWDAQRNRINFLDISRRAGIQISQTEFKAVQSEIQTLERRFQQVLADWQRLP